MTVSEKIKEIDLVGVAEASGVALKRRGLKYLGLCPFHREENPSFYIFPDNRFKCFGCGAHGDSIDFIRWLHNGSFKEACRHLGIEKSHISEREIISLQKKKTEIEAYRNRESDLAYSFGCHIRWIKMAMGAIKTIDDLEQFADVLHALPFWEHCHHILSQGDQSERREVVEALKNTETISRNKLFKPDFDFSGWLRNFINGVQINETQKRIGVSFE